MIYSKSLFSSLFFLPFCCLSFAIVQLGFNQKQQHKKSSDFILNSSCFFINFILFFFPYFSFRWGIRGDQQKNK